MSDLDILSAEAVDNCSIVYLIDENLCLGNSYEVMNTNFNSISSEQDNLAIYAEKFQQLYTIFSMNSGKWLDSLYNIATLSAQWESAYSTKEAYKKYWDVPIYLVYPEFVEFTNYYTNTATFDNFFKTWLETNFPPNQYILNQKIDLSINLYVIQTFEYNFNGINGLYYVENCTPASGNRSATVCCGGCPVWGPSCNRTKNGHHVCVSACSICGGPSIDTHCASYSCQTSSPAQTLHLEYNTGFSDRFINRIISLVYINDRTHWRKI